MFVSEEGEGEGAVFCVKGYFLCLVYKKGAKKIIKMERESKKNGEDEKSKKEREQEE